MAISATYVSTSSFTVAGDMTEEFAEGVRVRADCGIDGIKYGTVESASYADPSTTVSLWAGEDALTANLAGVLHGNDVPESLCGHGHLHWKGQRDAVAPRDIGAMPLDDRRETGSYAVKANERVRAAVAAPATMTLPAAPEDGDQVEILDVLRVAGTHDITVARNGATIKGAAEDLILDMDGVWARLIYDAAAGDWFLSLSVLGG